MSEWGTFYNEDCIKGCRRRVPPNSVDLIITDPPYGIGGDRLHKHYNRREEFVLDGYVEVPSKHYAEFSRRWITEAERVLRPGGSLYVVSGYTNLRHILNALAETSLVEVNHLIWRYNFGVYTRSKYISSHYHVLYYVKPGGPVTFNAFCRFGEAERTDGERSLNYQDREDVWIINREYKPGRTKNKNQLPMELLTRIIQYSSNPGDLVADLFLGSFSTAKAAIGLGRRALGFELSKTAFAHHVRQIHHLLPGSMLSGLRTPRGKSVPNRGKAWTERERNRVLRRYRALRGQGKTKKDAIQMLGDEFGRGRFSILNVLERFES